ncbi:uncharacterized protein FIBRA_08330 [Fibroporia radiculosa]|uniref:Uncharacterized protein n=1 Tax=Fibroporia radiculosa TaxID=599839 RepID=J4GH44_9APHY|nr:uncharacterized protein FIBRA_08330 [Fibroporia radiculosa]CCM06083.1 predicted protein [Fibroporia radiculosa]
MRDNVKTVTLNGTIGLLGVFAMRMAGKLLVVEELIVQDRSARYIEWVPALLHNQVFLHISATFGSVTSLKLFCVTFPSAMIFQRLIYALRSLTHLACAWVGFKDVQKRPAFLPPEGGHLLSLSLRYCYDVVKFLVESPIISTVKHVELLDYRHAELSGSIQRLLEAVGESLMSIHIRPDRDVMRSKEFPLNLKRCSNIQMLLLDLDSAHLSRQSDWLVSLFAETLPSMLQQITITFTETVAFETRQFRDVISTLYDVLSGDFGKPIDDVLCGLRFTKLRVITFQLRIMCYRDWSQGSQWWLRQVPEEKGWQQHIVSRFPKLHAQGIVRTPVSIELP